MSWDSVEDNPNRDDSPVSNSQERNRLDHFGFEAGDVNACVTRLQNLVPSWFP